MDRRADLANIVEMGGELGDEESGGGRVGGGWVGFSGGGGGEESETVDGRKGILSVALR